MISPLPWTATHTRVSDKDGEIVCVAGVFSTKEDIALIAAAPELLAALRAIVNSTEGIYHELRDAAYAAIKKAEGC